MRWIAPILLTLFAPLAVAAPCGPDVPKMGKCVSPSKVVWCEKGQQQSLQCDVEEACAWNEVGNRFDCLAGACTFDVDGDGTIESLDITGDCSNTPEHPDQVVWCEGGKLRKLACGMGTSCGWNAVLDAHDCLPDGPLDPEPMPETPDQPPDESPNEDAAGANDTSNRSFADSSQGGVPPIQYAENETADATPQGDDGGCSAAPSGSAPMGTVLLLMMSAVGALAIRRRRRA
ncbi:MAG: MYXO-CTERM domain-containing protein [Myxococcota bacterium]|jgi:MYXO-CTERM domain-containing protein